MSGNFCKPLKDQDPTAHALCNQLRHAGVTRDTLDQGSTRPDYQNFGRHQLEVTDTSGFSMAHNGVLEIAEIYDAALAAASLAWQQPSRYHVDPRSQLAIPWLPSTGSGDTSVDRQLEALIQNPAAALPTHEPPGSPAAHRQLAQLLYTILLPALNPGTDLDAYLYASYCRKLGIVAQPIELTLSDRVLIGLQLDPQWPNHLTFVDFTRGPRGFDVTLFAGDWVAISERELLAYHYLQQAAQPQGLQRALMIAPQNYRVIAAEARFLMENGSRDQACQRLRESLRLNAVFAGASQMYAHDC